MQQCFQKEKSILKLDYNNYGTKFFFFIEDASDRDRQVFLRHIIQAKKIAQYPNVHLVCMLGCVTEEEPLCLLTEYPEKGDLLTYLRTQRYEVMKE